jgi:hypothetical protein
VSNVVALSGRAGHPVHQFTVTACRPNASAMSHTAGVRRVRESMGRFVRASMKSSTP